MHRPGSYEALLRELEVAQKELALYKREFGEYTMECISCALRGAVRPDCPQCQGFNFESAVPLQVANDALFKRQEAELVALRKLVKSSPINL